ncbi:MAG: hypothetical protein PHH09_08475 [Methanoregulaceae archaeon]|nr:hypothetical protein [Methanoregulaceae archaeon]
MSDGIFVGKGTISINGEMIGECRDMKITRDVIEKEPDLESPHSWQQEFEPGPVYIEGHIMGGHFEKGRWVSVVSDFIDFITPSPINSPIQITTAWKIPVFEKGRHVRTDTKELDLGLFTVEKHGDTWKLKRVEEGD